MARDEIKAIIERGKQIPDHKSPITKVTKDTPKVDRTIIIEKPKDRQMVRALRTLRGVRK